jgi:hypothetical protein
MTKGWDLNIFFRDLGHDDNGDNQWSPTLTINPVVYVTEIDSSKHIYTDILIECDFAESRYIISERPSEEWGDDWFETLEHFLQIAPPRIAEILRDLPNADTVTEENVYNLGGLRATPYQQQIG